MREQSKIKCRQAFEKLYGCINDLRRNEDGEYWDFNLQLTWNCWSEAWKQASEYAKEQLNGNVRLD